MVGKKGGGVPGKQNAWKSGRSSQGREDRTLQDKMQSKVARLRFPHDDAIRSYA